MQSDPWRSADPRASRERAKVGRTESRVKNAVERMFLEVWDGRRNFFPERTKEERLEDNERDRSVRPSSPHCFARKTKLCFSSILSLPRSFATSTELTQPEPTTETVIFSSRESMSTTTRPPEADMSQEPSSWILSLVPWTVLGPDHTDRSSDQTTSSSDRLVPVTTGPRVTTPRELS